MKKILCILIGICSLALSAQVTTSPSPFESNQPVTINFNKSGTPLASYSGAIYAHMGVTVDGSTWEYVIGNWGDNTNQPNLTLVSGNQYKLDITPDLHSYFNVPTTSTISQICVVFRGESGSPQTSDIYIQVGSFQLNLTTPNNNSTTLVNSGGSLNIAANNTGGNANYRLKANGFFLDSYTGNSYSFTDTNITQNKTYQLEATIGETTHIRQFAVMVNPNTVTQSVPAGMVDGINLHPSDPSKATLVLTAPGKDYVYVAGSFNNWSPGPADAMKKDGNKFWIELNGLDPNTSYTYQYWVVDATPTSNSPALVKTADPYSTLVLSPYDDPYIPSASYPNLPAYPAGQDREVTVLKTGQTAYNWQVTNFEKPAKEKLVVYELLIRDFDSGRNFQSVIDRLDYFSNLGVNAIQLMPIMEYEGNESWGYNTSFHMALDKYYGTSDKFKELVDKCHQRGIAVILDIALNHAFGRNPMVRMWMKDPDGDGWGDPAADNPYFNEVPRHSYNVGSDFNHQSAYTQEYVKRVVKHWIQEYKIDGFRWDLTKGFTQNCASGDACTNAYQQDRVDILKSYASYSWDLDPTHYVIFEHLGIDSEEKEWANFRLNETPSKGVMLWGKMTNEYNQLSMGYNSSNNISRMGHMAHSGFNGKRVMGYTESHDEERLMYKNLTYGNNANASHNVRNLTTALSRMSAIQAISILVPGPKMVWHFGELGWELSLFTCNNGSVNTDSDATTGDCKLDTKPQPQWTNNWLENVQRAKIYNDMAKMIRLKTEHAVFSASYDLNTGNTLQPRLYIYDNSMLPSQLKNVVILTNFDVNTQSVVANFPYTGTWYNLMTGESLNVTNPAMGISIPAGQFVIYGNQMVNLDSNDREPALALALYPNPVGDQFFLSQDVQEVRVYSYNGQLVKQFQGNLTVGTVFHVSDLSQGMYLIQVKDSQSRSQTLKLIKQ